MGNICRWTDEETDDNVLGSGADQWEWYDSAITVDHDGNYHVDMALPDNDDKSKVYTFTRGKVRTVVTEISMGKHNVKLSSQAGIDDMDAGDMDCVIQICAYGKVVYG